MENRITLFCMTEKGYQVLRMVVDHYPHLIKNVVSSRDLNVHNDYYNEIKLFCEKKKINFFNRENLQRVNTSFAICVSWRWIIDPQTTTLIVFHDSLLPKYRGFSPLVSSLINGEKLIGVTALFATNNDYDCGDIILKSSTPINYPIKIQQAIDKIIENYKELVLEITTAINNGQTICGEPQNETAATYSLWRDENDYAINWSQSSKKIKRFIDALGFPYLGASTISDDKKLRVLEAELVDDVVIVNRTPGKIIFFRDSYPIVVCGKGLIKLTNVIDDETQNTIFPLPIFRLKLT